MAIGERIRFFRNLRGMAQKYLETLVGVSEKTADIRMAQYDAKGGLNRKSCWRVRCFTAGSCPFLILTAISA